VGKEAHANSFQIVRREILVGSASVGKYASEVPPPPHWSIVFKSLHRGLQAESNKTKHLTSKILKAKRLQDLSSAGQKFLSPGNLSLLKDSNLEGGTGPRFRKLFEHCFEAFTGKETVESY
jgi:hypothetical protein